MKINTKEARDQINKEISIELTEEELKAGFRSSDALDVLIRSILIAGWIEEQRRPEPVAMFSSKEGKPWREWHLKLPKDPAEEAGKIEEQLRRAYREGVTHSWSLPDPEVIYADTDSAK